MWRTSPEVALLSPSHLNPHNPPVITAHHSPHSMTRYLLSICYVPGTGLGSGETVDEQMAGSLRSWRLYLPLGSSLCSCVSVLRLCRCQGQCILLRPLGPPHPKGAFEGELLLESEASLPSRYLCAPSKPTAEDSGSSQRLPHCQPLVCFTSIQSGSKWLARGFRVTVFK